MFGGILPHLEATTLHRQGPLVSIKQLLPSLFIKKREKEGDRALAPPVEKKVTGGSARVGIIDKWQRMPTDHRASLCNSV